MAGLRGPRTLIALVAAALSWSTIASASFEEPEAPDLCEAGCGKLRGVVRRAGDRVPLEGARVLVVPAEPTARPGRVRGPGYDGPAPTWTLATETDEKGRFAVDGVPAGMVRIVIVAEGLKRYEHIEAIRRGQVTDGNYFPRPDESTRYRTVVKDRSETQARVTEQVLTREEIDTMPGTHGDALRGLQNLPGVTRAPGGLGLLVLRGASPNDSQVFLGPHAIPRAFHVLSLSTVYPAILIDELRMYPGNFDSAYGNASGGIVVMEPRAGRRDGFHGYGKIDLGSMGALVEGPAGKGSFAVGAQRAHVDAVLRAYEDLIEETGYLEPRYWDYQGSFDYPIGHQAALTVRALGAGDRLLGDEVDFFDPNSERQTGRSLEFGSQFHRLDLVLRKRSGPWRLLLTPSFRFELAQFDRPLVEASDTRRDFIGSLRAQVRRRITRRFALVVGADGELGGFRTSTTDFSFPDDDIYAETERDQLNGSGFEATLGTYTRADLQLGSVLLQPGLRLNGFATETRFAWAVDPRATARWDVAERWSLLAGLGLYSRPRFVALSGSPGFIPSNQTVAQGFIVVPGNLRRVFEPTLAFEHADADIGVARALQASLGVEHRLPGEATIGLTGFWREQDDGAPPILRTDDDVLTPAETHTRSYGLEILVRKRLTRRFYGWITYTLMKSELFVPPGTGPSARRFNGDFDQRHNLAFLASYVLPRGWRVGGRFRLSSGLPFTPVVGSFTDTASGTWSPIFGERNSAHFPLFHQLDLRVDKQWTFRRTSLTVYLDVQNVYNRQSTELYIYSFNYRRRTGQFGLPIFPALGVRVDF